MIKGELRENVQTAYKRWVGLENFTILKFNPNREELGELLETEIENEPVYTDKTDKNGNPMSTISVWMEGETTGEKFNMRFTLIDADRISQKGHPQYINSVGTTSYSDSKSSLPLWFTDFTDKKGKSSIGEKTVRVAKVGEEELYKFVRAWLDFDYYKPSAEILMDFDKLMKNDLRELEQAMTLESASTVIGDAVVRSVEKDGEVKQYQGVSTKAFMPGKLFRYLNNGSLATYAPKTWNSFKKDIGGEYGEKAFYSMDLIHEYLVDEDLSASNETKKEITEDKDDY